MRTACGRYGQATPVTFAFWSAVPLPPGWRIQYVSSTRVDGALEGQSLWAGPAAAGHWTLGLAAGPCAGPCGTLTGPAHGVIINGVNVPFRQVRQSSVYQAVCDPDVHGLSVSVVLYSGSPGLSRLGSPWHIASEFHLLGARPAGWTTEPLR